MNTSTDEHRVEMAKLSDEFLRAAWSSMDTRTRWENMLSVLATCDERYIVGALMTCLTAIPDMLSEEEHAGIASTIPAFGRKVQ